MSFTFDSLFDILYWQTSRPRRHEPDRVNYSRLLPFLTSHLIEISSLRFFPQILPILAHESIVRSSSSKSPPQVSIYALTLMPISSSDPNRRIIESAIHFMWSNTLRAENVKVCE